MSQTSCIALIWLKLFSKLVPSNWSWKVFLPSSRRLEAQRCSLNLETRSQDHKSGLLNGKVKVWHPSHLPSIHKGRRPTARPETAIRAANKRNPFSINGGAKLRSEHYLVPRVLKVQTPNPPYQGSPWSQYMKCMAKWKFSSKLAA